MRKTKTPIVSWSLIASIIALFIGTARATAQEAWGLNKEGLVFRWEGDKWVQRNAGDALAQVSVGMDKTAWGVNKEGLVFRWEGEKWVQRNAGNVLAQVCVANSHCVWGINKQGLVFHWEGDEWKQRNGDNLLAQLSVGSDETVWGVNQQGLVFHWENGQWVQRNEGDNLTQVSVGNAHCVWGVNKDGLVFHWEKEKWVQRNADDSLIEVSVGADESVWGINNQGLIFHWEPKDDQIWGWVQRNGGNVLRHVTCANGRVVWGVNSDGLVFAWNGSCWFQPRTGDNLTQIAASCPLPSKPDDKDFFQHIGDFFWNLHFPVSGDTNMYNHKPVVNDNSPVPADVVRLNAAGDVWIGLTESEDEARKGRGTAVCFHKGESRDWKLKNGARTLHYTGTVHAAGPGESATGFPENWPYNHEVAGGTTVTIGP